MSQVQNLFENHLGKVEGAKEFFDSQADEEQFGIKRRIGLQGGGEGFFENIVGTNFNVDVQKAEPGQTLQISRDDGFHKDGFSGYSIFQIGPSNMIHLDRIAPGRLLIEQNNGPIRGSQIYFERADGRLDYLAGIEHQKGTLSVVHNGGGENFLAINPGSF